MQTIFIITHGGHIQSIENVPDNVYIEVKDYEQTDYNPEESDSCPIYPS